MNFDPSTDPWGTAMLAAAALWVLAVLLVLTAMATRTSRRLGGRLLIVASLGFLGAAVGGTRERIIAADAAAAVPPAPTPEKIVAPPPMRDPDEGTPIGSDATQAGSTGATDPDEGSDTGPSTTTDDGDEASADDGEPIEQPPPPVAAVTPPPSNGPEVEPLPTDPDARAREIRASLRFANQVVDDRRRCANLDDIALAWARLRRVPGEPRWYARARNAAEDLEDCRRRLLYSASRRVRRAQVDARDAFAEGLADRFRKDHDLRVAVAISGNDHEKLRVGGSGLTGGMAKTLMDGAFGQQCQDLAFARVVLSDTITPVTFEFETTPEHRLGIPELAAVGLGSVLQIEKQ